MKFDPYPYPARTPRSGQPAVAPVQGEAPQAETTIAACVIPIGAESEIGDVLNPAAIVQRDLFLLHPDEVSFQRLLIGASQDTTPDFLSVQLVQKQGAAEVQLTPERVFSQLRAEPEVVEDATPWGEGPVFLRLRATYSSARLLVTVEALVNEVI